MNKKVVDLLEEKMKKTKRDLLTNDEIDLIIKDLMGDKEDDITIEEMED